MLYNVYPHKLYCLLANIPGIVKRWKLLNWLRILQHILSLFFKDSVYSLERERKNNQASKSRERGRGRGINRLPVEGDHCRAGSQDPEIMTERKADA